jgi:hypothetical protein
MERNVGRSDIMVNTEMVGLHTIKQNGGTSYRQQSGGTPYRQQSGGYSAKTKTYALCCKSIVYQLMPNICHHFFKSLFSFKYTCTPIFQHTQ